MTNDSSGRYRPKRFRWRHLALIVAVTTQAVISFYFLWLMPNGDEALHIYNASRVAQGQWPYVNFFSYITPGTYLLGGAVAALTANNVMLLRAMMAVLAIAGIFLMYRVINTFVNSESARGAWLAAYVAVTALTATYFSHHNIDQFLFVVLLYLVALHSDHHRIYAMLGTVIALDSFVHQAHGAYYFLAICVYILFLSGYGRGEKINKLGQFVLPSLVLYAVFGVLLALNGGLKSFFHDAIAWNVSVYAKYLVFGYFDDTIFHIERGQNLVEQAFSLASKTAILIGAVLMLWQIAGICIAGHPRKGLLLTAVILLAAVVGHLQTMHNAAAYYVLFMAAFGVYLLWREIRWPLYIVLACILMQLMRVASFPVRYASEMLAIPTNLVRISGNYFYRSEETAAVVELGRRLEEHDIREAVVINRSPELYFLLGISNPSRHDVIFPIYLTDEQLRGVLNQVRSAYVIYDRTLEKLKTGGNFFDTHHYTSDTDRLEQIERSDLFRLIRSKRLMFETQHYAVYE